MSDCGTPPMTKVKMRARALQSAAGGQPTVAAYGSWKSPITSNLIARQSIKLSEVRFDGDDIYWLEDRPQENGRCVVMRAPDHAINSAPYSARTEVHTYGGGAWIVDDGNLYFSNLYDGGRLYRQDQLPRCRSRSRPYLRRRKEIGAMPMASSTALIAATAVLATLGALPSRAIAMSVKLSWAGYRACSSSSPAFTVSDVPPGTARLSFKMVDKNVPTYQHGGGTVTYHGIREIPAGAFSYKGPCPPSGQQHTYEWTVQALDRGGSAIAATTSAAKFPPR